MDQPFIGQICTFGFNFPPVDWSVCAGQMIAISENQALFSLITDYYGGNARTVMGLPDFRGRVAVGAGIAPGLSPYQIGQRGGMESHVMTLQQMPTHNHTAVFEPTGGSATASVSVNCVTGSQSQTNTPEGNHWAETPAGGPTSAHAYDPGPPNATMAQDAVTVDISGSIGGSVTVGDNGGSQPFGIVQPYQTINYCIALQGLYPSRN